MGFTCLAGFASAAVLGSLLACGCSSESGAHELNRLAAQRQEPAQCASGSRINLASFNDQANYRIRPGDTLLVSSYLNPEFNQEVYVRPDGKISLKSLGDVAARDRTPAELGANLDEAYSRELRQPAITVQVKDSPSRKVFVEGQVHTPGPLTVEPHMTPLQAIAEAGGFTDEANTDKVVVIRRDGCGNPHTAELDLSKPDVADQDAELLPSDIVVVPRTGIANVDLAVKHYATDLLPVQPSVSGNLAH